MKSKGYFQRLKNHPGVNPAIFMTILSFAAAASNNHISTLKGALILGGTCASIFWVIVLLTNFKSK